MRIVIIGAGPTGLGALHRLKERGHDDVVVLERHDHVGGLSASFEDGNGFTWDIGGHVVFSHYDYFDQLLDRCLEGKFLTHVRESYVRMLGRWIPYPFQNNLRHLPPEILWECVEGLLDCLGGARDESSFGALNRSVLGAGICKHFMDPYNAKVWGWPLTEMSASWIAERVPVPDLRRVLRNVILGQDDVGWGPNATFRFPENGGTGQIFRKMAEPYGDHIRLETPVLGIDTAGKAVRVPDGEVPYDVLVNTAPLDWLARNLSPERVDLAQAAEGLEHNGGLVVGVGYDKKPEGTRCWVYTPGEETPFYRTTYFHHYSPNNAARPGEQLCMMSETTYSPHKPVDKSGIVEATLAGQIAGGFVEADDRERVASVWSHEIEYSYPVPTRGRDAALEAIQPELMKMDIYSRGRFGGWLYEIGNMDHSVMQGVELADRLLGDGDEPTWRTRKA